MLMKVIGIMDQEDVLNSLSGGNTRKGASAAY